MVHPASPTPRPITDADRARVAARYPRRRGPGIQIAAAVLAVALLAWTVWAGTHGARPQVSAQLFGYRVLADDRIEVQLTVHRPEPQRASTCTVQAQAPSGETVGELDVPVAAGGQREVRVVATVKTYLRAHTAIVTGCRAT